ncbi:MAG: hypothetical protein K0Q54_4734, partial [Methylobacterium brachiatum]|nr:hypothetical protein [Methylobacterium brachiatum]
MQPGTPEEWAEMRRAIGAGIANLEAMNGSLMRHTTASTFALVFLMQELEARGGLDRAALAEMTIAGLRLANPTTDAETERAVR